MLASGRSAERLPRTEEEENEREGMCCCEDMEEKRRSLVRRGRGAVRSASMGLGLAGQSLSRNRD